MTQQDENLGILEMSIQRLGAMSLTISNEIKDQNRMLETMDGDVDEAQSQLDVITKKTSELIKRSGYCIAVLTSLFGTLLLCS
jgi:hypothetical protein